MASLFKANGRSYYSADFYDKSRTPRIKRVSLKINDKRKAQQKLRQLEDAYALGKFDPWRGDDPLTYDKLIPSVEVQTLGAAVKSFLSAKSHTRSKTLRNYQGVLEPFRDFVGASVPSQQLTAQHVTDWLNSTETNPVSKATYRRQLRTFCRWLVKEGGLERDVTEEVKLERAPDKFSSKLLTPAQLKKFVEAAHESSIPYIADAAVLAYEMALRLSEVCAMKWDWIDLERRVLIVRQDTEFQTKTGMEVLKPIPVGAFNVLTRLQANSVRGVHVLTNNRGRKLRPDHTSKAFKRVARAAGLPESITFHSARHGGISKTLANGASIEAARRFAGHTTVSMTMRYTHLLEDQYMQQVLSAMNG